MTPQTAFEIEAPEIESGQTLLIGLASPGMAGLTTTNHIVTSSESTEIGHISPTELPAITPFEDGEPRHHTRLYDLVETEMTVLVGELFVPAWAAKAFAESVMEWCHEVEIAEILFLHPIPYAHGPAEHKVFHVGTAEFREQRLSGDIPAMTGGVLDGVAGELVSHSLSDEAPPAGVLITPAHAPGPDVEGSLRYLDVIEDLYEFAVDRKALEDLSKEIQEYYETLSERMETLQESDRERDSYADRMYM